MRPDRKIVITETQRRFSLEEILPFRLAVEKSQNVHERRFSGSRRSHDRHEFAFLNRKIDIEKNRRLHLVIEV